MKYIASCSFGKDSLAMLLKLIEEKEPLDEVIFYDTGMEFQAVYNIRDKILPILKENNIKYTELKPKEKFEYKMFEKPVNHRNGTKVVMELYKTTKRATRKRKKLRKEAIKYLYEHSQYVDEYGIHYIKEDEYCVDYLLDILNIDKGE